MKSGHGEDLMCQKYSFNTLCLIILRAKLRELTQNSYHSQHNFFFVLITARVTNITIFENSMLKYLIIMIICIPCVQSNLINIP